MFSAAGDGNVLLTTLTMIKVSIIIVLMLASHWIMRNSRVINVAYKIPWWMLGLAWSTMLILVILSQESSSSFIYFQF